MRWLCITAAGLLLGIFIGQVFFADIPVEETFLAQGVGVLMTRPLGLALVTGLLLVLCFARLVIKPRPKKKTELADPGTGGGGVYRPLEGLPSEARATPDSRSLPCGSKAAEESAALDDLPGRIRAMMRELRGPGGQPPFVDPASGQGHLDPSIDDLPPEIHGKVEEANSGATSGTTAADDRAS